MGKYFGTDGFRGTANVDLNSNHAFLIGSYFGQAAVKYTGEGAKIVLGKDTRISGDMFINSLCAGINSAGCEACVLGTVPTPEVAYVTKKFGFNFGIMVSASHNPYQDNGIKVLNMDGEKLTDKVIGLCEDYIDADVHDTILATEDKIGRTHGFSAAHKSYIDHLKSVVCHDFTGLKIAIDCANGSASNFAEGIFSSLGAKVDVIHAKPNGININVDCGSTHLDTLSKFVKNGNYDIGFAFDGDADRCLAVDSLGNQVSGDELMLLCGRFLRSRGELANDTIVTTVMSNFGLYKALKAQGFNFEKTDVGDRFVYENMQQNGHVLGGEQSGHIIFSKFATTGDGMLTALMVCDSLIELGETLEEAATKMKVYPQVLKNVTVEDKNVAMQDKDVLKTVDAVNEKLSGEGRALVRPSGTEPFVRVMVEATSVEICNDMVQAVIDTLDKKGHII